MACDVDELDINPFFKALQTKFIDLYNQAQEKCYTICIPQSTSIIGTVISKDFTETHILKPSPYFQGQLMSIHGTNSKTVTLADDGCSITTDEGFGEKLRVKIVSEELAYNKEYNQYRVLILDHPLDPKYHCKDPNGDSINGKVIPKRCVSVAECTQFLHSFPEFQKALAKVDQGIKLFNSNYMVLPDYLAEAASRLADISNDAVERCLKAVSKQLGIGGNVRDMLVSAMESYVMNGVHDKVFGVVARCCAREDACLEHKRRQQLRGIRAEALGIRRRLACPLPDAVKALNKMDTLRSPREKIHCLKSVIDAVTSGITAHLSQDMAPHLALNADGPCLTSDDLIPILVNVIGQSNCKHLQTDIIYMETFSWASSAKDLDDLSYCLVTFKAAVQYITDTDFHLLASKNRKQPNTDKHSFATSRLSMTNGLSRGDKSPSPCLSPALRHSPTHFDPPAGAGNTGSDRLERQMSRISKALEDASLANTKEEPKVKSIFGAQYEIPEALEAVPKSPAPPDLGDFLSSLQDDFVSFGKQN